MQIRNVMSFFYVELQIYFLQMNLSQTELRQKYHLVFPVLPFFYNKTKIPRGFHLLLSSGFVPQILIFVTRLLKAFYQAVSLKNFLFYSEELKKIPLGSTENKRHNLCLVFTM